VQGRQDGPEGRKRGNGLQALLMATLQQKGRRAEAGAPKEKAPVGRCQLKPGLVQVQEIKSASSRGLRFSPPVNSSGHPAQPFSYHRQTRFAVAGDVQWRANRHRCARRPRNLHIHGTDVPVEEPSTASAADLWQKSPRQKHRKQPTDPQLDDESQVAWHTNTKSSGC
jgi:hypothetical protein